MQSHCMAGHRGRVATSAYQPTNWVPHLRDGLIVAKVGSFAQSANRLAYGHGFHAFLGRNRTDAINSRMTRAIALPKADAKSVKRSGHSRLSSQPIHAARPHPQHT